jgi:hypothetical protein
VNTALPSANAIPLTPHPTSVNSPYVPQGMDGVNLFDTFEEEHMESPAVPRYNTRAWALQYSAHQTRNISPRIFRPIAFTYNHNITFPIQQNRQTMPMANSVINEDTSASLKYRHLIKDDSTFTV